MTGGASPASQPSGDFVERLAWICLHAPEDPVAGGVACPLCPPHPSRGGPVLVTEDGAHRLGATEIRVQGLERLHVVPSAILHDVVVHGSVPSEDLVAGVMRCAGRLPREAWVLAQAWKRPDPRPDDDLPFAMHWGRVTGPVAARVGEGLDLFAAWPSPVNADACFESAGFDDFGDADAAWEARADEALTRLLDELSRFGAPRLVGGPDDASVPRPHRPRRPWPFGGRREPEAPPSLREKIELSLHRDEVPDCVVAFGDAGVSLRTGSGHGLYWITWPAGQVVAFARLAERLAGPHPLFLTTLRWEHLRP